MPEEVKQREDIHLDKLLYVIDHLKDIAAEIVAETELYPLVVRLLQMVMATCGAVKGAVYLYDPVPGRLRSLASGRDPAYKVDLSLGTGDAERLGKNTQALTQEGFEKTYPRFVAGNRENLVRMKTLAWAPLGVQGKLVGLIALGEKFLPGGYSESDLELLTMIGRQVAVSVNNHQLVTNLNKTNQELAERERSIDTLYRISLELNEKMQDTNQLMATLLGRAMDQAGAQHGLFLYYDEDRHVLFTVPESLHNLSLPGNFRIPLDNSLGQALLEGRPNREEGDLEKRYGLPGQHLLSVPMRTRNRTLGMLCLLDKVAPNAGVSAFNERDVKILSSLANQAATTLDNARLYELATVDGMTKLYVRRYFDQRLLEETKKAIRFQKQLSLLMLDIDHFKQFNDKFGHQTGDDVLRLVAQQIKTNIRKDIDIPARYGGEELTVIMPETEITGAQQVAERILNSIEHAWLPGPGSQRLHVTVSIGVANLPLHAANGDELVKKADVALYRAKEAGRNRVAVYE